MAASHAAANERDNEVILPLRGDFLFAHEPLIESDCSRFAAREQEVEKFVVRVLNARGGAFLITGYRGVGKTTFVHQVIRVLKTEVAKPSKTHRNNGARTAGSCCWTCA